MVSEKRDEECNESENISEIYADILSKIELDLHQSELKRKKKDLERNRELKQKQLNAAAGLPLFMHVPPQFSPDVSASKRLVHMYKLDDPTSEAAVIAGKDADDEAISRAIQKGSFTKSQQIRIDRAANGDKSILHVPKVIEHRCGKIWRKLEDAMKGESMKQYTTEPLESTIPDNVEQDQRSSKPLDYLQNIMDHPQVLVRRFDNCVAYASCPQNMNQLEICWKTCIQYVSSNSQAMEDPKNELLACFALQCDRFKADVERCQGLKVMQFLSAATTEEDKK